MDGFEKEVIFFLPETPDTEIAGKLTFSSNQVPKLNLLGQLGDYDPIQRLKQNMKYPTIQGYLIDKGGKSEEVTLFNCYQKKELKTGLQTSEVYAEYMIKGYLFASLDNIQLNYVSVKYDHLEQWVNLPNITGDFKLNEKLENVYKEITFTQKVHDPITLAKVNDFSIIIYDTPVTNPEQIKLLGFLGWNSREILIKENKKIIIKSEEFREFKDFQDIINLLQNFLTFASGQVILPSKIESSIVSDTEEVDTNPMELYQYLEKLRKRVNYKNSYF